MAAGRDPARFWVLTFREADREMAAAVKIREQQANERIWLAWHIAALSRTDKLPKLETLLSKPEAPKRRQTGEEMLLAMKSIFYAFGGDPAELELTNEPGPDR